MEVIKMITREEEIIVKFCDGCAKEINTYSSCCFCNKIFCEECTSKHLTFGDRWKALALCTYCQEDKDVKEIITAILKTYDEQDKLWIRYHNLKKVIKNESNIRT